MKRVIDNHSQLFKSLNLIFSKEYNIIYSIYRYTYIEANKIEFPFYNFL
jgi:hypothetical protein